MRQIDLEAEPYTQIIYILAYSVGIDVWYGRTQFGDVDHMNEQMEELNFNDLNHTEKLDLVRFVCTFAWADLDIAEPERKFVCELVERLGLPDEAVEQAISWLDFPPNEDEVDPNMVPDAHRKLFLDVALEMVGADGVADVMEIENYALFKLLMGA